MRTDRSLLPHHDQLLRDAGIAPDVIAARGYRSLERKADVRAVGFTDRQALVPCLLIPLHGPDGTVATYQIRPDQPRIWHGQPLPYEMPASGQTVIDVPLPIRDQPPDTTVPLLVMPTVLTADAAASRGFGAISLHGAWLLSRSLASRPSLPDLTGIALDGRTVVLALDGDARVLDPLAILLRDRGADVRIWSPPDDAVPGIDAILATGASLDAILVQTVPHQPAPPPARLPDSRGPYRIIDGATVWLKPYGDDVTPVQLANFTARIREVVIADDGQSEQGELVISGRLASGPHLSEVRIATHRFDAMQWVTALWGTRAIITAGQGSRDRLREAIQRFSLDAVHRREYIHPGWREIDGVPLFLTSDVVIGPDGPVDGIAVRLDGPASRIRLGIPPAGPELRPVIRVVLELLDRLPDRLVIPLLGGVFRAVLRPFRPVDVVLFLVGPSGAFKSELAAAIQRCFGPDINREAMPGSWTATANALERLVFDFKDCLVVIDDFAPAGTRNDLARYHQTADRVIRGAGNVTGRGRMQADGTLRPALDPRGLILSTGEDVPSGYSIRARMLVLEVEPGMIDRSAIDWLQGAAGRTLPSRMLAGFVQWIAAQFADLRQRFGPAVARLRTQLGQAGAHARTPDALAGIGAAWQVWLDFAQERGGISAQEREALWQRVEVVLHQIIRAQDQHLAQEHPVDRFLDLLRAVIASGAGHVAGPDGEHPATRPEAWGWRQRAFEGHISATVEWQPQGERIGWVDADGLYLLPAAAYQAVHRYGATAGSALPVTASTLWKRFDEAKLLLATDRKRNTLRIRKQLGGARQTVLHLAPTLLDAPADQADAGNAPPAATAGAPPVAENGQLFGTAWAEADGDPAHAGGHTPAWNQAGGQVGQVGQSIERGPRAGATTCARCGIRRTVPPSRLCPQCEEDAHDPAA